MNYRWNRGNRYIESSLGESDVRVNWKSWIGLKGHIGGC